MEGLEGGISILDAVDRKLLFGKGGGQVLGIVGIGICNEYFNFVLHPRASLTWWGAWRRGPAEMVPSLLTQACGMLLKLTTVGLYSRLKRIIMPGMDASVEGM